MRRKPRKAQNNTVTRICKEKQTNTLTRLKREEEEEILSYQFLVTFAKLNDDVCVCVCVCLFQLI